MNNLEFNNYSNRVNKVNDEKIKKSTESKER